MDEYGKLLKFLESQNIPVQKSIPEKSINLETSTKKLIEEHQELALYSDAPQSYNNFPKVNKSSKGFDVSKFESLMKMKLIDEYKRIQSYERPYISVTELCQCLRKSYYSRLSYPVDLNKQFSFAYLSLINNVGDSVHSFIQSLYDFTETEKTVVSDKYKVKGRVDGIREDFLLEIKTIDEKKFQNNYFQDHYNQALIYSYILNSEYNYKIKTITLVYVLRDLKTIVPFDLPLDDNMSINFLKNAIELRNSISKKIAPNMKPSKEQCNFCLYKKYCEKEGNNISNNKSPEEKDVKITFLL